MLRLILATFLMEEIKKDSSNCKNENRAKNTSENQKKIKNISAHRER
jgi:hypothetical protein